jgi:hypothetical protein
MTDKPTAQVPLLVALAFVAAGVIIAAVGGLTNGSIIGGVVAGAGVIPSCWAAWAGMQKQTQGSLAVALLMVFVSLGVGALLLLMKVVHWFS